MYYILNYIINQFPNKEETLAHSHYQISELVTLLSVRSNKHILMSQNFPVSRKCTKSHTR